MIVTVTANPSVDRTFEVDQLLRGQVVRATRHRVDPAGKGLNVSRALHANGHDTAAVLPIGGSEGRQLLELLEGSGVTVIAVPIAGAIRSNVTVIEPDGTLTKINEPGPTLSAAELDGLVDAASAASADAAWLVLSGSLPPGAGDDLLGDLISRGRAAGARTAVDSSGPSLAAALEASPDLIKPNASELAEISGRPLETLGDAIEAARLLVRRGARTVLASLGPDGALLVADEGELHAELAVREPNSTVGAGDATLAGYLSAADDPTTALRAAVAFGAAAVALPGSQMPQPTDLRPDHVRIHPSPDRLRALLAPVHAHELTSSTALDPASSPR